MAADSLSRCTVGIVGLGLIGGSLALALRPKVRRVVGIDPDPAARRIARRRHAVHKASADLGALANCDLVVVAAPQAKVAAVCARAARRMRPGATLVEVSSVKGPVVERLGSIAAHVNIVCAHPMAGTEHSGMENAVAGLFKGRPFVLLPARVRDRTALALARQLPRALGARALWMLDAAEHDALGARLIHLPHLLAYALVAIAKDTRMAGPSFRSATRVARSLPRMAAEMLHANRREIRRALPAFARELRRLARLLDSPKRLQAVLAGLRRLDDRGRL